MSCVLPDRFPKRVFFDNVRCRSCAFMIKIFAAFCWTLTSVYGMKRSFDVRFACGSKMRLVAQVIGVPISINDCEHGGRVISFIKTAG